jgi:hypothetical protein
MTERETERQRERDRERETKTEREKRNKHLTYYMMCQRNMYIMYTSITYRFE